MSDGWGVTECLKCGDYFANHHGVCPKCEKDYHERRNAIIDDLRKPVEKAQKGASKQRSKKVSYDGYTFDSQKEFERYLVLKEAKESGRIFGLIVHPKYTLIPATHIPANVLHKTRKQSAITYEADFEYMLRFDDYTGIKVIEDVKGAYGNTAKNRAKGIAGKPIISEVSRLRHKLLAWYMENKQHDYCEWEFCIITDTSAPLAEKAK